MPGFMVNFHATRKQKTEAGKEDLTNQHVGTTKPLTKRNIHGLNEVTTQMYRFVVEENTQLKKWLEGRC